MHKSRVLRKTLIALAILVVAVPMQVASAAWTSWDWKYSVSGYPVTGGSMYGSTGVSWWDGSELLWQIQGVVSVPTSLNVYVNIEGWDKCSNTSWTSHMQADKSAYNTTGATTSPTTGYYSNCASGHQYRVFWNGQRQQYSGSTWEGTWTYVYFP